MRRPACNWRAGALAAALPLVVAAGPALAHGATELSGGPWAEWSADAWIVAPLILAAWVYLRGAERGRGVRPDAAFFGGLAAYYLALQSPIEPLADRVFIVHQVEHMGLRTVAPLLLMLAEPQAALIRGLPRWARSYVLAPLAGSRILRGVFRALAHPAGATLLFIGASYFWMVPGWHDRAILDEPVHYTWHVTLMLSGLIFFWRVFDPRPNPVGASLPTRLVMLWFGVMGNILLGTYLSFKGVVLYHAYDVTGRVWGLDAASDERFGGLTMWIPGSMMFVMAALAVMHRWRRQEQRGAVRDGAEPASAPIRANAFVASRRSGNRALALGILGFVAVVFVLSILVAIAYDRYMFHV